MSTIQEIQAQTERTNACQRHDFGAWDKSHIFAKLRCKHCGCMWRMADIGTYIRGYEAAGGNGTDILRDWSLPHNADVTGLAPAQEDTK